MKVWRPAVRRTVLFPSREWLLILGLGPGSVGPCLPIDWLIVDKPTDWVLSIPAVSTLGIDDGFTDPFCLGFAKVVPDETSENVQQGEDHHEEAKAKPTYYADPYQHWNLQILLPNLLPVPGLEVLYVFNARESTRELKPAVIYV